MLSGKLTLLAYLVVAALFLTPSQAAEANNSTGNPDFTKGGKIPEGANHDWTLGATGDQIKYMLWHLHNGGLVGMKDRNPRVVLVMIGTNNRGIPELHGYDTAYGVLALLKEVHA